MVAWGFIILVSLHFYVFEIFNNTFLKNAVLEEHLMTQHNGPIIQLSGKVGMLFC